MESGNALDDFLAVNDFTAATSINPTDLESEMINMAALYSRFGVLTAKARSQRDAAKSRLELVEAKLDKTLRDEMAEKGEKVTENKLRSEIVMRKAYLDAVKTLNEANSILSVAETALMSLQMKRDMLVQLNKNAEREWNYSSALSANSAANREEADALIRKLGTK